MCTCDKNININVNIDSLVEELRFSKEEIMILKENNIKMRIKIDKVREKLEYFTNYVPDEVREELVEYLKKDYVL